MNKKPGDPLVLDMHSHFLINAMLLGKHFNKRHGHAFFWNPLRNQYDLPKSMEGGVGGTTFMIYMPWWPSWAGGHMGGVRAAHDCFRKIITECKGEVVQCTSALQIRVVMGEGRFAAPLAVEGAHVIGDSLDNLAELKSMGVRMITMVHFVSTRLSDAVWGTRLHGGLSAFGKSAVRQMQDMGVLVDLAHTSSEAFWDAIGIATAPMVLSHTGAKGMGGGSRGADDEQLKAIKDVGGVVGVLFNPWYLKKRTVFCRMDLIVDHIAYIADKIGIEHVAIGTDCEAPNWLPMDFKDVSYFPVLTEELRKRGFGEDDIRKIYSENYLRVLEATDEAFRKS